MQGGVRDGVQRGARSGGAAGRGGAYRRKHVGHAAVGPRTDLGVGLIRQYLQPDRLDVTAQQDQGCIVVELVQGVGVHLGAEDAHAGRVLRLGPFSGFLRDRQNARTLCQFFVPLGGWEEGSWVPDAEAHGDDLSLLNGEPTLVGD